ncbi:hypothetical protein R1flu_013322 [Riccia fluitans]|uniref:F-box domain-containing protein n=1 Tax=Riccia fluitans TaxID=41844 RepID=A0ABD1YD16_9MARC
MHLEVIDRLPKDDPCSMDSSNAGIMMADRYIPKEVMCRILTRLPVRSFIRLRSVCKRWHSLMEDPEFQDIWSIFRAPAKIPFLLWHHPGDGEHILALDLAREWRPFPTAIFLSIVPDGKRVSLTLLSSTKGLFLIKQRRNELETDEVYFTINPLTRSVRQLPLMTDHESYIVRQMIMIDEVENRYIIIAEDLNLDSAGHMSKLQMYDSAKDAWQMIGELPYCLRFKSAAFVNRSLYCLAAFTTAHVFRFDGTQSWHEVKAKVPLCTGSQLLRCVPSLFQHRGRLMLVGTSDTNRDRWQREAGMREWLEVWELDEARPDWIHVHSFSSPWFLNSKDIKHHFLTSGDYLFLTCVSSFNGAMEGERTICNLRTGSSWREILPTPKKTEESSPVAVNIFSGFCIYEPSIEMEA